MTDDIHLERLASFSAGEIRETYMAPQMGPVTIHRPQSGSTKGVVLLLPGWSGPRSGPADVLVFLASKLAYNGWAAVRLDLPGRGDASVSGPVDLDTMIASALNASPLLRSFTSESGPARRVVLGICSGGNVALGAVPMAEFAAVDAVVAISTFPFQPARTMEFDRRRRWKNLKNYALKSLSPSTWLRLLKGEINVDRVKKNVAANEKPADGRNLKDSARDIEKELLRWKGAALFVWGGGDEEAPPARTHYEKLHANGLGEKGQVKFQTVAGANHNFYGKAWRDELARTILEFLEHR